MNYGREILLYKIEELKEKNEQLEYNKLNNIYVSNNTQRKIERNKKLLFELNKADSILKDYLMED